MKLDATIVVPAICVFATLIVGWFLAWQDIREYKREINELASDLVQEQADKKSLREEVRWLRQLKGSGVNLRYEAKQTGQVANKNESENLAYYNYSKPRNPALSRNVSNPTARKQTVVRSSPNLRTEPGKHGIASGATSRAKQSGSEHNL